MKILLVLIATITISLGANIPKNFTKAKDMLTRLYYTYHMVSFYTNTPLVPIVYIHKKKFPYKSTLTLVLGMENSPYQGTKYVSRGTKIEWEHITPASWFTTASPEIYDDWYKGNPKCITSSGNTYKGRKCAEKASELFNKMEGDMYNLVPIIGALNAMRSDKPYGIIEGEAREFGKTLDVEINSDTIELEEDKRGNVARVLLYMNKKYGVQFPDHNNTVEMLKKWDSEDPEDDWEKQKKEILKNTYGMEF